MNKLNQKAAQDHIFNLQVSGDKYGRLIVLQKRRLKSLEEQLEHAKAELEEVRRLRSLGDTRGGGVNAVKSRLADEKKEIAKLENRLSASKIRESKMNAANAHLKFKIDEARKSKLLSKRLFEKNQRQLREIQKAMRDTFQQANDMMTERDRVVAQINLLTNMDEQEQQTFDLIYKKLSDIVATERENAAFYRKQAAEIDPLEMAEGYQRGNINMDEEASLKKTLNKLQRTLQEEQSNIEITNQKLEVYASTFKSLQEIVNVDDQTKLVEVFSRGEEENFALFKFIQSVNNEIEQIEEQKVKILEEQKAYEKEVMEGRAHARRKLLEGLEEQKKEIQEEDESYQRRLLLLSEQFHPIARAVDKLFISLGCHEMTLASSTNTTNVHSSSTSPSKRPSSEGGRSNSSSSNNNNNSNSSMSSSNQEVTRNAMRSTSSMPELLAATGVTESNIVQFLSIIEHRSSEIMTQYAKKLQAKGEDSSVGRHLKRSDRARAIKSLLPDVNVPLDEDGKVSSDEEEADRPMTKEELQRRAAKSITTEQIAQRSMPGGRAKPNMAKKKK